MPTFTSGTYHIKWTQLADFPVPINCALTAVQDKKVYVAGGISPDDYVKHQVYVYNINTDQWGQLPPPGQYFGVPHIIGGKLAIIGGRLSSTKQRTNKVSTFDETSQTWTSYYPDLLSVRSKPGVATHLEHIIVAGGVKGDDTSVIQDDIEVLNWIENSHWRKVFIKLPVPMNCYKPIIADDHFFIVGYSGFTLSNGAYKILVTDITRSGDWQQTSITPTKWITMTPADFWYTDLVPGFSPPVIVGGHDQKYIPKSHIKMYDDSKKSWRNIGSLSSARSCVAIATINDNAIIAIGGCTNGKNSELSSLTTVELIYNIRISV